MILEYVFEYVLWYHPRVRSLVRVHTPTPRNTHTGTQTHTWQATDPHTSNILSITFPSCLQQEKYKSEVLSYPLSCCWVLDHLCADFLLDGKEFITVSIFHASQLHKYWAHTHAHTHIRTHLITCLPWGHKCKMRHSTLSSAIHPNVPACSDLFPLTPRSLS